jgi:hypothetical protein
VSVAITESGHAISTTEIEEFERVVNWKLPVSYREFLVLYNGGRPDPDVVDIENFDASPTDLQLFLGIQQLHNSCELKWNYDLLADRRGERLLPFACDSGGNLFALTEQGGVGYVEVSWAGGRYFSVAPSFDEFLKMISK